MSFSSYGPRTIGRCMYFLRYYCGLHVAETCTFGEEGVYLCDDNDATIEWDEDGNPTFTFVGSMARLYASQRGRGLYKRWVDAHRARSPHFRVITENDCGIVSYLEYLGVPYKVVR